jgi:hypothetical protein
MTPCTPRYRIRGTVPTHSCSGGDRRSDTFLTRPQWGIIVLSCLVSPFLYIQTTDSNPIYHNAGLHWQRHEQYLACNNLKANYNEAKYTGTANE